MLGGPKEREMGKVQEYGTIGHLFLFQKKTDTYGLKTTYKNGSFHCLSKSPY